MKFATCLLFALALLGTSGLALADGSGRDQDHRGQHHTQHQHGQRARHVEPRQIEHRRPHRGYGHRRESVRAVPRYGYRPAHPAYRHARWMRGHRYDGPIHVVSNYGYYRLRPPPRGYRWVRNGDDFLLVAISTGIILDLALR